jgi:hypothetical protein
VGDANESGVARALRGGTVCPMNLKGHPESLVASHRANFNAAKSLVYSPRSVDARAAEICDLLAGSLEITLAEQFAWRETTKFVATLEFIDNDLVESGLFKRNGVARSVLFDRVRVSRKLARSLAQVEAALARADFELSETGGIDAKPRQAELERIALRFDRSATARDRLRALRELGKSLPPPPRTMQIIFVDDVDVSEIEAMDEAEREHTLVEQRVSESGKSSPLSQAFPGCATNDEPAWFGLDAIARVEGCLAQQLRPGLVENLTAHETAVWICILEHFDGAPVIARKGASRVAERARLARVAEQWIGGFDDLRLRLLFDERDNEGDRAIHYAAEIERIARGYDKKATARDRIEALKEHERLGTPGPGAILAIKRPDGGLLTTPYDTAEDAQAFLATLKRSDLGSEHAVS